VQKTRASHFVPQAYLRRWAGSDLKLWCYRLLVSHNAVPKWKRHSIRGMAYQEHLYTTLVGTEESDEFEHWIEEEFETPGQEAIEKAASNGRLTPQDWRAIVRYAAAQDVRTPARYYENVQRWNVQLPQMIQEVLNDSVEKWEAADEDERKVLLASRDPEADAMAFPFRVAVTPTPAEGGGIITAETVPGRQMWISSMRLLLSRTIRALLKHRWSFVLAPDGVSWLTSDDPVIRLNYKSASEYDFGGGWGSQGSDIIFPLSPTHLLFTQIGHRHPDRIRREADVAEKIQRLVAEHAHRWIYAQLPQNPRRSRVIDSGRFLEEAQARARWHKEQTAAQLALGQSPPRQPYSHDGA